MQKGFSLVELSIVLVILGLLTGGILAGQNLIHAAELRSVTSTLNRYESAIYTFRDKYFALPGDMRNATDFWGAATACPGTNSQPSTGTETCNGNGNGLIDQAEGTGLGDGWWRAWQHLANAGLVEGQFTGVRGTTDLSYHGEAGVNMPRLRLGQSNGIYLKNLGSVAVANTTLFPGDYGNVFDIYYGASNGVDSSNLLAEDVWHIDTKMDDGLPGTGAIRAGENQTNCVSATNPSTAQYLVQNTSLGCRLIYNGGF